MRRCLVLLFALLLPLQFAWGAAAAYCQHETAPTLAQHFGHHEHMHKGAVKAPADGKFHIDADCSVCNAGAPHAATAWPTGLPALALPFCIDALAVSPADSPPARAPDRPQWPRLA